MIDTWNALIIHKLWILSQKDLQIAQIVQNKQNSLLIIARSV